MSSTNKFFCMLEVVDWSRLPEHIDGMAQRWLQAFKAGYAENGDTFDMSEEEIQGTIIGFLRNLVTLARVLQQRPALRALLPHVHHGEMDLFLPDKSGAHINLYGREPGRYMVTYHSADGALGTEWGVGDMEYVAELIETKLQAVAADGVAH